MDTSLLKEIHLCTSSDHKTYGKVVRYWCFWNNEYFKEKHSKDYEAFMRKCDANIVRLMLIELYPEWCDLAKANKLKSINVDDALRVIYNTIVALSGSGMYTEQYHGLVPHSVEMLQTVAGYMQLVLPELNTVKAIHGNIDTDKIYTKLLHLVEELSNRYCTSVNTIL